MFLVAASYNAGGNDFIALFSSSNFKYNIYTFQKIGTKLRINKNKTKFDLTELPLFNNNFSYSSFYIYSTAPNFGVLLLGASLTLDDELQLSWAITFRFHWSFLILDFKRWFLILPISIVYDAFFNTGLLYVLLEPNNEYFHDCGLRIATKQHKVATGFLKNSHTGNYGIFGIYVYCEPSVNVLFGISSKYVGKDNDIYCMFFVTDGGATGCFLEKWFNKTENSIRLLLMFEILTYLKFPSDYQCVLVCVYQNCDTLISIMMCFSIIFVQIGINLHSSMPFIAIGIISVSQMSTIKQYVAKQEQEILKVLT